ncbi:hypothetical protein [Achromobacter sp. AGC39]
MTATPYQHRYGQPIWLADCANKSDDCLHCAANCVLSGTAAHCDLAASSCCLTLAAAGLLLPNLSMHAFTLVTYASHSDGSADDALPAGELAAGGAAGTEVAGGAAGVVGAGVVEAAGGATFSSFLLQPARMPTKATSATAPISLRSILMVSSFLIAS